MQGFEIARLVSEQALINPRGIAKPSGAAQIHRVLQQGFAHAHPLFTDVVVVSNESCGRTLRDEFRVVKPMVMWNHHADDQPAIEALEFSRERKAWSSFAFVSDWQRNQYCSVYWVAREKTKVMRNAVSPAFAAVAPASPWFRGDRAPVLVYTSAPYRGLEVVLAAFPSISSAHPGTRLRVFS